MLLSAQMQPVEVKRTQEKTIVNGKVYYIHTIQKGQTLYSISKAYEVSQDDIIRENPGIDPAALKEGQALRIPACRKQSGCGKCVGQDCLSRRTRKISLTIR